MNTSLISSLAAAALIHIGFASAVGQTAGSPPLTIVQIVQRLEQGGYGPFSELSMDDGNWEVEVRLQSNSVELTVDPASGKILTVHPDDAEQVPQQDAMPLSKLLQTVSANGGYEYFDEISFARRYWEIEVFKDGQKRELLVDPITARVIVDRIDN